MKEVKGMKGGGGMTNVNRKSSVFGEVDEEEEILLEQSMEREKVVKEDLHAGMVMLENMITSLTQQQVNHCCC